MSSSEPPTPEIARVVQRVETALNAIDDGHETTRYCREGSCQTCDIIGALNAALRDDGRTDDTEYCRRCGGPNVTWSAASPLWNYVMRGNDITGEIQFADLVCMPCFIFLAVEAGLPDRGWRLTLVPEPEGLIYVTPSGRVWDPERFLWVEPDVVNRPEKDG